MPRTRSLKPRFFKDTELADLPMAARMFYAGLWCQADREGRLEDNPKYLKSEIFPYDDVDTEDLLKQLAKPRKSKPGFIVRYEAGGQRFIFLPRFLDHQKPYHREADSTIPPPPPPFAPKPGNGTAEAGPQPQLFPAEAALSSVFRSPSTDQLPPKPPAKSAGGVEVDLPRLLKRRRTNLSAAEQQFFAREQRVDAWCKQLGDWLAREASWAQRDERPDGMPPRTGPPTREEQLAKVQELGAGPAEAERVVRIVAYLAEQERRLREEVPRARA